MFVDFSQGFNRVMHSKIIEILDKMKVPGWLLKIMVSYFTKRNLKIRFKDLLSEEKELNAGVGQGCLIGLWCFLILVNFAGPQSTPGPLGLRITENIKSRKPIPVIKRKWIDDLSILTAIDLKKEAVHDPTLRTQGPLQYHSRTEHHLPEHRNPLQSEAMKLQNYANENFMRINPLKTKVAIFNPLHKVDIMPQITFDGENNIEVVEEYKLLGQIVSTDMKTIKNTNNILKKCYSRMYMLRRLNSLGCPRKDMIDILKQQILSIAEQAVPYWGPRITKVESQMLEGILKTGLHIILQDEYVSFKHALKKTGLKSLAQRRKDLIFSYAKKAEKSDRFSEWFQKAQQNPKTRNKPKSVYKPVMCRTNRFSRSALPVLTKALSWHPPKVYIAPEVY